jgi:hypothetical protein
VVSRRARAAQSIGTRIEAVIEGVETIKAQNRTPADDGKDERIKALENKVEFLNSANWRAEQDLHVRGADYALAVLDPGYVGPGKARVRFLPDGSLSGEYYDWLTPSVPWGNRVVEMVRRAGQWFILGHSDREGYGGKIDLEPLLVNGWKTYNEQNAVSWDRFAQPRAQRLHSGIVVLSGLVAGGSTATDTAILTLPVGYRPDTDMLFPVNNADTAKVVRVKANGEVQVQSSSWVSGYASLDGIAYPAAGVATWTNVGDGGSSFQNSWVDFGSSAYGVPRYWKDPYGFVWFSGLIKSGSTTDNAVMINLPSNYRTHLHARHKACSGSAFGIIGSQSDSGLVWKIGTTSNSWVSLGGVVIVTNDAITNNPWKPLRLVSGWANYGGSYTTAGVVRREDGLAMTKGLIRNGTVPPIQVSILPRNVLSTYRIIFSGVSDQTFSRQDLFSATDAAIDDRGAIHLQSGSTTWVSFDNHIWMVGD